MMALRDKVALVTGASSGIGEAIAIALSLHGVRVTITARRKGRLKQLAQRIRFQGGRVLAVAGDLRSEMDILRIFEKSQAHWGRLDILINNAGVGFETSLRDGSTEAFRAMLEVNVLAPTIAAREALRIFPPKNGGHIVNIGSTSGHRIPSNAGFYVATKFALRALTEILRNELQSAGDPTKISLISPGRVSTDLFRGTQKHYASLADQNSPEELSPKEVAKVVLQVLQVPERMDIYDIIFGKRNIPK